MAMWRRAVLGLALVSLHYSAAETYCNENGTSANFTAETISTSSGDIVLFWSNNCPAHAFEDNVPAAFSDNCAVAQDYTYRIPATPVFRNESGNQDSSAAVAEAASDGRNYRSLYIKGRIGFSRGNTMLAYPGTGSDWDDGDAMVSEATTFDYCGGHANPILADTNGDYVGGGYYHIHGQYFCLDYPISGIGHSPLVGWMLDGFPLYGLYDDDGERPDDLDECNGHTDDEKGYHYHTTGFSGLMEGEHFPYAADSPEMAAYGYSKPYTAGCFKGCVPDGNDWAEYQMESYAECVASSTAAPSGQLTLGDTGFSLATHYFINENFWTEGQGAQCPNPVPTPTPSPAPTITYTCSAAPTHSVNDCSSKGGECVQDEQRCVAQGKIFSTPGCGSKLGTGCGCCYDASDDDGTDSASSTLFSVVAVGAFGVMGLSYFGYGKLQKYHRHRKHLQKSRSEELGSVEMNPVRSPGLDEDTKTTPAEAAP